MIHKSKICNSCGQDKSLTDFSPLKGGKYGKHPKCRDCRNKINKQKRRNEHVFIYALIDPFSGIVWYIGRSTNPSLRLQDHIAEAKCSPHANPRKAAWLLGLLAQKTKPQIQTLEAIESKFAPKREAYWILYYRGLNPQLLNGCLPIPNYWGLE